MTNPLATKELTLGADHGGFELKQQLLPFLQSLGHQVYDVGAHSLDPLDDFPDFAKAVAERVASAQAWRGIVICGSGVGASVAANKVPGVRASVCHDAYSARQGVEHDDMNVLCLGARIISTDLAKNLVIEFLNAGFLTEEKYQRRLDKVLSLERSYLKTPHSRPA